VRALCVPVVLRGTEKKRLLRAAVDASGASKNIGEIMGPREYDCEDMPGGNGPPIEAASRYHDDLLKMLTIADDGPVVMSARGKAAIRWAVSMLNVLGDKIANDTGLPIPVVLDRASKVVEHSEEFNWPV
jgi:hypothetical protein